MRQELTIRVERVIRQEATLTLIVDVDDYTHSSLNHLVAEVATDSDLWKEKSCTISDGVGSGIISRKSLPESTS